MSSFGTASSGGSDACRDTASSGTSCLGCDDQEACCWVCLSGAEAGELVRPCGCPRHVHRACLARWQLQQVGKPEEQRCRFCALQVGDWRDAFAALPRATPLMTVVHEGVAHQLAVESGPEGQAAFMAEIRRIFHLGPHDDVSLSFGVRLPQGQGELTLDGPACFEAATFLASLSAGERQRRYQEGQREKQAAEAAHAAGGESPAGASSPTPAAQRRWSCLFRSPS